MKRLGWVRYSESDSQHPSQGQFGSSGPHAQTPGAESNWSFVPEAPIDAASCFDPSLAAQPKPTLPAPVMASASSELPVKTSERAKTSDEEAKAWLEAVAKAKAQSGEQSQVAEASADEEPEEDWEALMAAARQRAEADASPVAQVLADARERAKSEPPIAPAVSPVFATVVPPSPEPALDAASAQVEQGAVAANDDRPAVKLNSIPTRVEPGNEEEEWKRLRAEVDAKEEAENERKLRAMREIRRLRGSRGNTGNVRTTSTLPRRFAAGTVQPPIKAAEKKKAIVIAPGPAKARPAKSPGATTTRSLPRITKRLNNGS